MSGKYGRENGKQQFQDSQVFRFPYFLNISDQAPITIHYEQTTRLPVMNAQKTIYSTTESLDITGFVTSERNQNLTHLEKLLLRCYFKLGHTGLSTVHWVLRKGCLGNMGEKMGSNNFKIPKCSDFHYGKQEINPKSGTRQSKDKLVKVSLKIN